MGAETSWISVILALTWIQVGGLSYCLPTNSQQTSPSQCDGYTRFFTDGSKTEEAVGYAAIVASRLCKNINAYRTTRQFSQRKLTAYYWH